MSLPCQWRVAGIAALSVILCWLRLRQSLPPVTVPPISLAAKIGGPKLWPRVSPNKTISGSVGGLVAAMAVTSLVASVFGIDDLIDALIMGLVIGGLSQAGDLMESAVKRRLDVKDSGAILPGHGGMLDRFDGYIFVIPAVYMFVFGF